MDIVSVSVVITAFISSSSPIPAQRILTVFGPARY